MYIFLSKEQFTHVKTYKKNTCNETKYEKSFISTKIACSSFLTIYISACKIQNDT